ncbi:hypothetical protein Aca07nite_79360 [Actinoplanes capillaceus]|uniref:Uncharacterized protein n=1 Tax=Actinoplanes campanulatus TaxID=113559 RepID=A0ABQ3WWI4_9ACTN|nr:hypothetical protein Aca07nite_79360 [Actinoplanes capillaceus]
MLPSDNPGGILIRLASPLLQFTKELRISLSPSANMPAKLTQHRASPHPISGTGRAAPAESRPSRRPPRGAARLRLCRARRAQIGGRAGSRHSPPQTPPTVNGPPLTSHPPCPLTAVAPVTPGGRTRCAAREPALPLERG